MARATGRPKTVHSASAAAARRFTYIASADGSRRARRLPDSLGSAAHSVARSSQTHRLTRRIARGSVASTRPSDRSTYAQRLPDDLRASLLRRIRDKPDDWRDNCLTGKIM